MASCRRHRPFSAHSGRGLVRPFKSIVKKSLLPLAALVICLSLPGMAPAQAPAPNANGKIAFGVGAGPDSEIYVMNADGSAQTRLTNNTVYDAYAAWSPDGTRIAFSSGRGGGFNIYVMNADGSDVRRLTNNTKEEFAPAWSPDGTKIAFHSNRDSNPSVCCSSEIYVMNPDGSNQTRLTTFNAISNNPRWSPDGTKIVFDSNKDGPVTTRQIFVMGADSGDATKLTTLGSNTNPRWSPDGSKIAFVSGRDGNSEIYMMGADGANQVNLTNNPAGEPHVAWSPDGTKIAFARFMGSGVGFNVFVMNADGGGQTNVSNNSMNSQGPDWQPVPQAAGNPIDESQFFVRQHYLDFLNRDPDTPGLQFWVGDIEQCGADAQCREVKRINVSAAFFLSIEFQQTGYLAYRAHKAAFGNLAGKPVPVTRPEMLQDMQVLASGVVVGAEGWEQKLEQNKQAYFDQLAATDRFAALYPQSLAPEQFVDALNANAGGALAQAERDALVSDLRSAAKTRALVLRAVAEDEDLTRAETNRAFVLMQYFGYLRRNPDDAPDVDFSGWQFWLTKLNQFNGNFVEAEMVKAFLSSIEYRQRFGQ